KADRKEHYGRALLPSHAEVAERLLQGSFVRSLSSAPHGEVREGLREGDRTRFRAPRELRSEGRPVFLRAPGRRGEDRRVHQSLADADADEPGDAVRIEKEGLLRGDGAVALRSV